MAGSQAGADTPATRSNPLDYLQPLNEGRGRDPGDTVQKGTVWRDRWPRTVQEGSHRRGRSTKAGAETPATLANFC